jgi:prepilin-type N-terminal cleavage/methylation domain-containing protein
MLTAIMPLHLIRFINSGRTGVRSRNSGFTLVELLIALLLGALVIGGVATVFISSQQTYLRLTVYNNAQEAFRYASHAITRLTRGAEAVWESNGDNLVLQLGPTRAGTNQNCLGAPILATEYNRFCISNGNLICEVSNAPIDANSACPAQPDNILVRGIGELIIEYASGDFTNYVAQYGGNISDWSSVTGARVTIRMTEGYEVTFTASVRSLLIPDEVVVRPSG